MGVALEKPKLFPERKTFFLFAIVLLLLIVIRLIFIYSTYTEFISKPFYYTTATVLTSYEKTKKNKRYKILKVKSDDGLTFYTTSYAKEDFSNKRLRLQIFPNENISFVGYLGTFYVKSKIKSQEILGTTFKDTLLFQVSSQHTDSALASFYNAILFATPLDKSLREKIALMGVSHLVALSGFHLGILWGLVYGLILFVYRPFQQKYFPYRHALFDVGIIAMSILGIYVWFVGAPPSLLRSYAMVFVGWGVLLLGMELLSFTFLASVFLLLGAVFPSLLVSLSFWLSVAGVFYIFLLLQYTKHLNKWLISLGILPFGIFVLMLPIVHIWFEVTSVYQLLSPLLSIAFIPFYPLVMVLHGLGFGGVLDDALLKLFMLPTEGKSHLLPWWITTIYSMLSLAAIANKKVFYLLLSLATLYLFYLLVFI